MKNNLLILSITLLIGYTGFSQTVNGVPIKDINAEYIQIMGSPVLLKNKLHILIDFGQFYNALSNKEQVILDSTSRRMQFNSMIEALNFMSANGYEFVQAYGVAINNKEIEHYYLLRRKK
ncbi:MAG: hypothetical protein ACMG51_00340 [Ginsengibacter sp.]